MATGDSAASPAQHEPGPLALQRGNGTLIPFLLVVLLTLVPALAWEARLLAGLPHELVPQSASMTGVLLGQLHRLPVWAAVAGLNFAALYLRPGARSKLPPALGVGTAWLLVLGVFWAYGAIGQAAFAAAHDTMGGGRSADSAGEILLLTAAVITAGQILWLLWGRPGGVELAHLFLAAAAEWLLVFASMDFLVHWHAAGQTTVPPAARFRLFEVAQFGVLANLAFAVAVGAWPELFGLRHPRPRAWLLTLGLYNLGLLLLLTGVPALTLASAALMLVGVLLLGIGLDLMRSSAGGLGRRSGGAALLWLMAVLVMIVILGATSQGLSPGMGYDPVNQALEQLLVAGFVGTFIVGMAARLSAACAPVAYVPRKLLVTVIWSYCVATLAGAAGAVPAIPAIGALVGIDTHRGAGFAACCMTQAAGAGVQCLALALLALAVVRTRRAAQLVRRYP